MDDAVAAWERDVELALAARKRKEAEGAPGGSEMEAFLAMETLPLPDLVVYRAEFNAPRGTPEVVANKLKDLKEQREELERMWREAGETRTYIPNTTEAKRMKLQAKLRNRVEAKHATVVRRQIEMAQKPIELDFDELSIAKRVDELVIF